MKYKNGSLESAVLNAMWGMEKANASDAKVRIANGCLFPAQVAAPAGAGHRRHSRACADR